MKHTLLIVALSAMALVSCHRSGDCSIEKHVDYINRVQFSKTREQVADYIRGIYPEATDEQIDAWTADGTLESMEIDGELMYFNRTAPNLFLVDSLCRAVKLQKNPVTSQDASDNMIINNIRSIRAESEESGRALAGEKRFRIRYTITVDADAVPAGEKIRCWLPTPRENARRNRNVNVIATSQDKYRRSDIQAPRSSIYMEKEAVAGQPTVFWEEFEFSGFGEYHDLRGAKAAAYDKSSELYKRYTAEQAPHIVFTDTLRALSKRITAGKKNPIDKAAAIFKWVDDNFPWAGALNYSTIDMIPEYVLDSGHGDCGQVTLLFMTLCRIAGIPCRWESGLVITTSSWNMHDWCEAYFEGFGWVPIDQSAGVAPYGPEFSDLEWYYFGSTDSYRIIINNAWGRDLEPKKWYPHSDMVDFQLGEVEWKGGNLYFDKWDSDMEITRLN
ncbi:MAG: transglutaminase-like domain-containing protein [Bacteroidales bacterium]|nr:transglutaminase-like domain-containing protein [Bacteroidales bacterium]